MGINRRYSLGSIIYNHLSHPLRRYLGLTTWTGSNLFVIRSPLASDYMQNIKQIHGKYGNIVRLAPNEVSFVKTEALNDILANQPGHRLFPKNYD